MYSDLFKSLDVGDYIYISNEKGEGISGTFEGEYDSNKNTFKFSNHSNGKMEVIRIEILQHAEKIKI